MLQILELELLTKLLTHPIPAPLSYFITLIVVVLNVFSNRHFIEYFSPILPKRNQFLIPLFLIKFLKIYNKRMVDFKKFRGPLPFRE